MENKLSFVLLAVLFSLVALTFGNESGPVDQRQIEWFGKSTLKGAREIYPQVALEIVEKEERNGVEPLVVAKKLERIIISSKPKQRYRVGSFSQKFAASLKGTLPDSLVEWLLYKFYKV